MKTLSTSVACIAIALAAFVVTAKPARPARDATALAEDKGKFNITVNGQMAGTEDFSITRSGDQWVAHGTTEIGSSRVTGELRLNSAGQPLKYSWSTNGDKKITSTTVFEGSTAHITLEMDGKPVKQDFQFAPPVVILDNNMYHQYEILARIYNWTAGGAQNFSVLIPQEQSPGTITVESGGSVTLDGAKYDQLQAHTPDLQVTIYLDSAHRLMRLTVPAAKAEIRRQ